MALEALVLSSSWDLVYLLHILRVLPHEELENRQRFVPTNFAHLSETETGSQGNAKPTAEHQQALSTGGVNGGNIKLQMGPSAYFRS